MLGVFAHVGPLFRILGRSRSFASYLQRGGTCAAHGIRAKLAVSGVPGRFKKLPKSFFWERVFKMLPRRFQNGSKRNPKEAPEVNFGRFFDGFGKPFSILLAFEN